MFRERRFYSNVRRLVFGHLAAAAVLGIVALGLNRLPASDAAMLGKIFAIAFAAFCVVFSVVFVAARRLWPTEVGPAGLRGYNSLGRYDEVPWDQIESVRERWGYLWIARRATRDLITIPLWLEDFSGFSAYVVAHAPSENALVTSLRARRATMT